MKIIALGVVMILFSAFNLYSDQTNKWEGVYTFEEESWNENRIREYRWFRLEISKKDAKTLTAIYSDGLNGKTFNKFLLTVMPTKNNVIFNFEKDLTPVEIPCSEESNWRKGEKFLELTEKIGNNGKPLIETLWGRMDYSAYSETGGGSTNKIFFKRQ